MITFKRLFTFSPQEISNAFKKAHLKRFFHGLKLLESPIETTAQVPHGKLLVVISSLSGKAHDRNRVRRHLKALFYEEKLYQKPSFWIIIVQKAGMSFDFDTLKQFMKDSVK